MVVYTFDIRVFTSTGVDVADADLEAVCVACEQPSVQNKLMAVIASALPAALKGKLEISIGE